MSQKKENIKSSIESLHDYGICLETRVIQIFGDITSEMKEKTISNLHLLDQTTGEITILLSSSGGNVSDGLAIYDTIKLCKNHVNIVAIEEVASMGTVIFQAGDKRVMQPNSYLLLHEGSSGYIGKSKDKKQHEKMQKWQDNTCYDIYLRNIRDKKESYTKKALEKKLEVDWILFPEEVLEWGLCDSILSYSD